MSEEKTGLKPEFSDPESYRGRVPFVEYNHMEITKVSPEESEIRLRVNPDARNLMGQVHGGLIYSLADTVTGITARADGRKYVTESATVHFLSNVSEGTVIARGVMIRRGRKTVLTRGIVEDENGRLLADVTISMFCITA